MSNPVTITEAAALHIKDMMKEHEEEKRVSACRR